MLIINTVYEMLMYVLVPIKKQEGNFCTVCIWFK